MYIDVKLLNGFTKELTYRLPDQWPQTGIVGSFVKVPLQKRIEPAIITRVHNHIPDFATRPAHALPEIMQDTVYRTFIDRLSTYHQTSATQMYHKIAHHIAQAPRTHTRVPPDTLPTSPAFHASTLTDEQTRAYQAIVAACHEAQFAPFLLHGVTGSGKTIVYQEAISYALAQGKSVLLLAPEIALAQALYHRLVQQLGTTTPHIYTFHSATSMAAKRALWEHLYAQTPLVLIGVQIPLLLPIAHLSLIIVDEEHESAYQWAKAPYIHTRDAAVLRAHVSQIPIVLGSATPSVTSWYQAQTGAWRLLTLSTRYTGALPTIQQVLLEKGNQKRFWWLTPTLEQAIEHALQRKEQIILFLNRKGYSTLVQCAACQTALMCTDCSIPLVYHQDNTLRCHYCGKAETMRTTCPACHHPKLFKRGLGNQQVIAALEKKFPTARIARADVDTSVNQTAWNRMIQAIHDREIDIIVGTQTIAKGHHFPHVKLVGVIWADSGLYIPSYLSCEHTLQQLMQVAGRAGRSSDDGKVIIQTIGNNPVLSLLDETQYGTFCAQELEFRQTLMYPPYTRFACLLVRGLDEQSVIQQSKKIASKLADWAAAEKLPLIIKGPTTAAVFKIKKLYTMQIYLKAPTYSLLVQASARARAYQQAQDGIELQYVPNPVW